MEENIGGGEQVSSSSVGSPEVIKRRRRALACIFDLLIMPLALGVLAALALFSAPEIVRNTVLILVNAGWMIFRDLVFSPGRWMADAKIVSLVGGKITFAQALIRNIHLIIPIVLVGGYVGEFARIVFPSLLVRRVWYLVGIVIFTIGTITAFLSPAAVSGLLVLPIVAVLALFLLLDREQPEGGERLIDAYAKTRVTYSK